jgi:hypothetical protein
MKRKLLVTSILALLLAPALTMAGQVDKITVNALPWNEDTKKALPSEQLLIVPVELANTQPLEAADIPLSFSEGATLEKVTFTDRVKGFEIRVANIDNENHTVAIGLLAMVTGVRPALEPGTGAVAELHFKLDPGVDKVEIDAIEMQNPNHSLTLYYNDWTSGRPEVVAVHPEFESQVYERTREPIPTEFALSQNSPNPFNPSTKIMYALPAASDVTISVFNVLGQRVTELVNGHEEAGFHEVIWNGKDNAGRSVASGVYFYRIEANQFNETKKMLLLK